MDKKIGMVLVIILVGISLIISSKNGIEIYQMTRIKVPKVVIEYKDDMSIEFNTDNVKVSDFIKSINGEITDDYIIDTTVVGTKRIYFDYINDENIKINKSFEIEVKDTTEPVIWLGSTYRLAKGNRFPIESILCGDNYDKSPTCYIEGKYNIDKTGSYPLTFKATDSSGNTAKQDFVLTVYEPVKSNRGTSSTYEPNYIDYKDIIKKYKTRTNKIGIDVSKWQGDIDFETLSKQGVEFIILRVGYTKGTNGEYILDPKFKQNMEGAKKYNIPVGLYFYSYANSIEHSIKDANWVLEQIKDYKIDLPIAFDWEEWLEFNEYEVSFYELTNIANAFMETIENKGYKSMLYSSKSYLEYIWLPTKYDIWLAHFTDKTNYKGKYKFWQLTDSATVDGIKGSVDVDIMYD